MHSPTTIDLHVHTHLSPCGKPAATADALIRRAHEKGIGALGFADHITPRPVPGCAFYDRQRPDLLAALRDEVSHVSIPAGFELLVGLEADYALAGTACLDAETLAQADHVICAASHFHLPSAPLPVSNEPRDLAELMLSTAREALCVPGIDIWAHPFDCSTMRPLSPLVAALREDELVDLIDLANARQVAIEINGGPAQHADYRQATAEFFRLARRLGARFTVTSDAHHPDDLDRLDLALSWAQELGLRDSDLLTLDEVRARQRRRT